MKIRTPEDIYLEKARSLNEMEAEFLQSRMRSKLQRRLEDKKINLIEAMAIQLELEALQLKEWRERMAEIRAKHNEWFELKVSYRE